MSALRSRLAALAAFMASSAAATAMHARPLATPPQGPVTVDPPPPGFIAPRPSSGGVGYSRDRFGPAAPANVRLVEVRTTRGLASAAIRSALERNASRFAFCFGQAESRIPIPPSGFTTRFVVGPAGSVMSAQTAPSARGTPRTAPVQELALCYSSVIRSTDFPAPQGGVSVSVVLRFRVVAPDRTPRRPQGSPE